MKIFPNHRMKVKVPTGNFGKKKYAKESLGKKLKRDQARKYATAAPFKATLKEVNVAEDAVLDEDFLDEVGECFAAEGFEDYDLEEIYEALAMEAGDNDGEDDNGLKTAAT